MLDVVRIHGFEFKNISVEDKKKLENLDFFGANRLKYIRFCKKEFYNDLYNSGKLIEHLEECSERAFEYSESLQDFYLKRNIQPDAEFMEIVAIRTMAQHVCNEIVLKEMIFENNTMIY